MEIDRLEAACVKEDPNCGVDCIYSLRVLWRLRKSLGWRFTFQTPKSDGIQASFLGSRLRPVLAAIKDDNLLWCENKVARRRNTWWRTGLALLRSSCSGAAPWKPDLRGSSQGKICVGVLDSVEVCVLVTTMKTIAKSHVFWRRGCRVEPIYWRSYDKAKKRSFSSAWVRTTAST